MKTKTYYRHILPVLITLCSTLFSNSQILVVDQITGSAQNDANAIDLLVNDLIDTPHNDCNSPAVLPGILSSDFGVLCSGSATQEGTLPMSHETHCHTGSRAYLNGDQSSFISIRWKNTVANFAISDDYLAWGDASLDFNTDIMVDGVPPGTNVQVYYRYTAFIGASTDHETDGLAILDEDTINIATTLTLDGIDLLPVPSDFQDPGPAGSGWNSVKDVYGSFVVQAGTTFNVHIASDIHAEINPLGKITNAPFQQDQSDGIFHGIIEFTVIPFHEIDDENPGTELLFSLDIGSDSEFGDPNQDGDEAFDPGEVYLHNSANPTVNKYLDDLTVFGIDPIPDAPGLQIPYHAIPMDLFGPDVFDLDGFEVSDYNLSYWKDYYPFTIQPTICTPQAEFFIVSFDDDTEHNWSDGVPSLPVESNSPSGNVFGDMAKYDEVKGVMMTSGPYSTVIEFPFLTEQLVHMALAPDPLGNLEDDDVDALAIDRTLNSYPQCEFQYFSPDREGRYFDPVTGTILDPGSIYQAISPGVIEEVITPVEIGILPGTDVDAFTFGALANDDFDTSTFALFFSVDENDPMTFEDESGGLDPRIIYISIMSGLCWEYSTIPLSDDIDALSIADPLYGIPQQPCADQYYPDNDGDGYGDNSGSYSCQPQPGYTPVSGDCDDGDPDIYPGAPGTFQDKDNNCDGTVSGNEIYCLGDFNHDGSRNTLDLLMFISAFGCTSNCGHFDLNGDGEVNSADVLIFLSVFGTACP